MTVKELLLNAQEALLEASDLSCQTPKVMLVVISYYLFICT